ncbi:MAG: roadblock/LC7 domain-containing protein [Anaerolineales bacterium]
MPFDEPDRLRVTRFQTIDMVLNDLCREHGLDAAVLVGPEGLPLAAADSSHDPEALAAVTNFFRRAARQVQSHLKWPVLDEVTARTQGSGELVGRSFFVEGEEFLLVVLLPRQLPYRAITSQAIQTIRWVWNAPSTQAHQGEEKS